MLRNPVYGLLLLAACGGRLEPVPAPACDASPSWWCADPVWGPCCAVAETGDTGEPCTDDPWTCGETGARCDAPQPLEGEGASCSLGSSCTWHGQLGRVVRCGTP
jgi:hypothetical protein